MGDALNALRYVTDVPEDPRPRGEVGAEDDRDWVENLFQVVMKLGTNLRYNQSGHHVLP